MDVPKIGGTRGIFEIFVPGVFLFINLTLILFASVYPFFGKIGEINEIVKIIFSPLVLIVIFISFGYLLGVVLRLISPNKLDKLSGKLFFTTEEFPYIKHFGKMCEDVFPDDVLEFYNQYWRGHEKEYEGNSFINYCKLMTYSIDVKLSREVYSAESLTRYLSGIYHALKISLGLYLIPMLVWTINIIREQETKLSVVVVIILICIFLLYIYLIRKILQNFRKIRVKEAFTIFIASYKLKDELKLKKTRQSNNPQKETNTSEKK